MTRTAKRIAEFRRGGGSLTGIYLAGVRKTPAHFAGSGDGWYRQLNVSPMRRISQGSIVLGFTSPLKSGKNPRISAAVRIGAPVTETRAPNTSASFADSS